FGALADRIGGLFTYLIASLTQTALVFWFTQVSTPMGFYVLAVLFGFGFSGVMTSIVILVREKVPLEIRGISQGVVLSLAWIGMGLGGWQGGFFYDFTGGYELSFAFAVLAGILNFIIITGQLMRLDRISNETIPALEPALTPINQVIEAHIARNTVLMPGETSKAA
ncbi:MAG: MFS transporter, partial [bacterium]